MGKSEDLAVEHGLHPISAIAAGGLIEYEDGRTALSNDAVQRLLEELENLRDSPDLYDAVTSLAKVGAYFKNDMGLDEEAERIVKICETAVPHIKRQRAEGHMTAGAVDAAGEKLGWLRRFSGDKSEKAPSHDAEKPAGSVSLKDLFRPKKIRR